MKALQERLEAPGEANTTEYGKERIEHDLIAVDEGYFIDRRAEIEEEDKEEKYEYEAFGDSSPSGARAPGFDDSDEASENNEGDRAKEEWIAVCKKDRHEAIEFGNTFG